ncbi:hypothetical protein A3G65_04635 [Candidatus Roizmanbacteria bacterium RIFCSPLOWO2_12_FULL_37_7b]|nr:MAG: hypothetical protein A3G65_04635 [Candidatus Roizmanbacteria bacterium RIFCSPLOWO2_12_FULL_37_7b]
MEQHAVPRQITTFEFKLIGFMTVKQFIYLAIFAGMGVVVYNAIPVPILNIIMGGLVVLLGAGLAFYKHNERTLDVWIIHLITSLLAPSQYYYMKNNHIPDFLSDVFTSKNEDVIQAHMDAQQKLHKYIQNNGQTIEGTEKKQDINTLIHTTKAQQSKSSKSETGDQTNKQEGSISISLHNLTSIKAAESTSPQQPLKPPPFLSGVIKNSKEEPLSNIMVYVNSETDQPVRILKTNRNGIFATFHPLPSGQYKLNPKDLGGNYFFDTMDVVVNGSPIKPINVYSKEIL